MRARKPLVVGLLLSVVMLLGNNCPGLNFGAVLELQAAGVNKYMGDFEPASSEDVGDGWTKHTYDPDGGDGPICITGTPYSVFTREGNPSKLLVMLQGGGACWQDFYFCSILAEDQAAPAPFLARLEFGNFRELTIFNDAGPIAVNLANVPAATAREADWQFSQFYPESCTECDPTAQATAVVKWRLDNDSTIREAFYETDADGTNRFFTSVPTQEQYRDLILTEHGLLNDAHPNRYKRFIVRDDGSHTTLQSPLFYSQDANGVPLNEWTAAFLASNSSWIDIVEDLIPLP